MSGPSPHNRLDDFETLRSHARAMRSGVWASYADDVLAAVDRLEEQLETLRDALTEWHERVCGCDQPGRTAYCVAGPECEVLNPANNLGTSPAEKSGRTEADPARDS